MFDEKFQCVATAIFAVGFFIFPVWYGGCCNLCAPGVVPCAKNTNIASIVMGVFMSIIVPLLVALLVVPLR